MTKYTYTWRKDWISDYESLFSIFEKFKLANNISNKDVRRLFELAGKPSKSNQDIKHEKWNLLTLEGINAMKVEEIFQKPILMKNKQLIKQVLNPFYRKGIRSDSFFDGNLKYCQTCISSGFHSIYQQFYLVDYCPFHDTKLHSYCINCNSNIKFDLLDKDAFNCSRCGFCFLNINPGKLFYDTWGNQREYIITEKHFRTYINNNLKSKLLYYDETELSHSVFSLELVNKEWNNVHVYKRIITKSLKAKNTIIINTPNSYKEIYSDCLYTYKAIARYIRRAICKRHRKCIKWYVKNHPKFEGCKLAEAYVYWRYNIEGLTCPTNVDNHFQKTSKSLRNNLEFPISFDTKYLEKQYRYLTLIWDDIEQNHEIVSALLTNYYSIIIMDFFNFSLESIKKNLKGTQTKYRKPIIFYSLDRSGQCYRIQLYVKKHSYDLDE